MGALRTLTAFFLAAALCGAGYAGSPADFHPLSAVDPPVGTYVVYCIDDTELASIANELAAAYHGQIEPYAQPGVRAFAITMLPSRARLMSLDPRVRAVIEQRKRLDHAADKREAKNVSLTQALQPHVLGTEAWGPRGLTYDGAGNITAFGSDTYAYDTAGRLLIATAEGSSNRQTYGHDGFGNRVSAARDSGAAGCGGVCETSPQIQPSTNHLSDSGVVYDAAGDLRALGNGNSFTYDAVSMATRAQVGGADLRYVYTADDERIAVYANAAWTWTVRDLGGRPIREFTSANQVSGGTTLWGVALRAWSRDTIWRGSLLLASVAKTSQSDPTVVIQHFHLDHLGTPRLITDAAGVKTSLHNYYPFGAELAGAAEPVEATTKFTGHTRDLGRGTGAVLDYMHARYYDGMAGRFLSMDPVLDQKRAFQHPQAWNRYAYVENNPVRITDPTGKCPFCVLIAVAIVGGTFLNGDVANAPSTTDHTVPNQGPGSAIGGAMKALTALGSGNAITRGLTQLLSGSEKPSLQYGEKIEKQLGKRGWDKADVERTVSDPARKQPGVDARNLPGGGKVNDPATVYFDKEGHYVVVNNKTGDVVQVSNRHDPGWMPPVSPKQ